MRQSIVLSIFLGSIVGLSASTARAQQPDNAADQAPPPTSSEQWYYQQMMERYENPKTTVRRNAEFRAQQRRSRIAAMKWYGLSNSRPVAAAQPFTSPIYSPSWQGSWGRPYGWYASQRMTVIVGPDYQIYR